MADEKKEKRQMSAVWGEARSIVWEHRARLTLGLAIMLVNRLAGLVTPATSKFLIDDVVGEGKAELLPLLAAAVAGATIIQASSSFALSQVLGRLTAPAGGSASRPNPLEFAP